MFDLNVAESFSPPAESRKAGTFGQGGIDLRNMRGSQQPYVLQSQQRIPEDLENRDPQARMQFNNFMGVNDAEPLTKDRVL